MKINCIVIDHQNEAMDLIKLYIAKFPALNLVRSFTDVQPAAIYLHSHSVDLMFADINLPVMSGIELVKSLKLRPMVIFTSASRSFAIDGFDLEAVDYLLKPLHFERFNRAIYKALQIIRFKNLSLQDSGESIFVRSEYKMIKINLEDVEYIESLKDYIKIHQTNNKPVLTLMPLKKVLEKLPPERFKRIHRSYIVPLNKVKSIYNKKVQLTAMELPLSESYLSFAKEWMNK